MVRTLTRRSVLGAAMSGALASGGFFSVLSRPARAQVAPQDAMYGGALGFTRPVEIGPGRIKGLQLAGVEAFRGIPYGSVPPDRRFMEAVPVPPWSGVRDATAFGPACVQRKAALTALGEQGIYAIHLRSEPTSEDCLTLNVWTRSSRSRGKRPVMVWLHGGGFAASSAANPACDGANLARHGDVVVVSLNHRLGLFGFLNLAELGGEAYRSSANIGMVDVLAALRWVQDNIAEFGGDPRNVTLFGGAAGGEKISVLLAMPATRGLIHKAIIASGPRRRVLTFDESLRMSAALLEELELPRSSWRELTHVPVEKLLVAEPGAVRRANVPRGIGPAVDGTWLTQQPFDKQAPVIGADVPILIGTNKDEMTFSAFTDPTFGTLSDEQFRQRVAGLVGSRSDDVISHYRTRAPRDTPTYLLNHIRTDGERRFPSIEQAEFVLEKARSPVYMYLLAWESPIGGGVVRSVHMLEQPLVFRNVALQPNLCGADAAAYAVSDQMSEAWLAFARRSDPSNRLLPAWPRYEVTTRATMIFDVKPEVQFDPGKAERELWQRLVA